MCAFCAFIILLEGLIFVPKYTNTWYSKFTPCGALHLYPSSVLPTLLPRMMARHMYDNTGAQYNVSRILTPQATLDEEEYKRYSPLFLSYALIRLLYCRIVMRSSASFAISYGTNFASITATLVHSILYFRKQIWLQARRSLSEQPDVHARLMARYPQGS